MLFLTPAKHRHSPLKQNSVCNLYFMHHTLVITHTPHYKTQLSLMENGCYVQLFE